MIQIRYLRTFTSRYSELYANVSPKWWDMWYFLMITLRWWFMSVIARNSRNTFWMWLCQFTPWSATCFTWTIPSEISCMLRSHSFQFNHNIRVWLGYPHFCLDLQVKDLWRYLVDFGCWGLKSKFEKMCKHQMEHFAWTERSVFVNEG